MKIQLANYQYTGSYAKLRNAGNKSFPYSVKVEGFGTSKTKGSLFDFASVSITEHFEKDKYVSEIKFGRYRDMFKIEKYNEQKKKEEK